MKTATRSILVLRPLLLAGAALLLLAAVPGRAPAAFILTLTQTAGNVVVTGSGSLNTTALTLLGTTTTQANLNPASGVLFAGSPAFTTVNLYNGGGLTGPAAFGTGSGNSPGAGTGSFAGIVGSSLYLLAPAGYTSGTALADTDTFTGATFASLGFTPGTYTYTWGTGTSADSLTIIGAVPEPSAWALLGVGTGALALAALRRRTRAA